jgi:DNA (cytosine-5)-methyltransferase 1
VAKVAENREAEPRPVWPEATVVAEPVRHKGRDGTTAPRVLVRRNRHLILGPREQDLITLPGRPVISLFTGAGGFDLGVEQAGFCCLVQHEWDHAACETLLMNRPGYFRHAALIQGDIRQTPTGMLLREANLRVGEACLVIGGPPCQGFSTANPNRKKAMAEGDARNDLVFEFLRVVREAKPEFFIMENVPGLVDFNKGEYFEWFLREAFGSFYELVYGLVDAVEYGVPQYRCRFICMGTRRDLYECEGVLGSLPEPVCFSDRDLARLDTLGTLFPDADADMLRHPPGIRYFPDRPVLRPPRPTSNRGDGAEVRGRSKAFVEFYRKLLLEEPDRIVTGPRDQEAA